MEIDVYFGAKVRPDPPTGVGWAKINDKSFLHQLIKKNASHFPSFFCLTGPKIFFKIHNKRVCVFITTYLLSLVISLRLLNISLTTFESTNNVNYELNVFIHVQF